MPNQEHVIMQILPTMESGGVERGTLEIAKGCMQNNIKCIVVSNGGRLADQLSRYNAEHIKLPVHSKNPLTIYKNIKKLVKLIKKHDVDIVHARSRAPAWSAYYACLKTNAKFITTFHGVYSISGKFKKRYNSIMLKGQRVIVASKFIENHIKANYEVDENILTTIARGVDFEKFDLEKIPEQRIVHIARSLNINYEHPVLLLPGRLTQWKGQEFLIEALAKLKDYNFDCLIAGDDKNHLEYKMRLQEKIIDLKLTGKVRLIGNIDDMPVLYSLADVVISSSLRPEAFGRIAIEAQSMGKPVIATAHGGSLETIIDNETGWLVEPANIDDLVLKIKNFLETDKNTLEKMSKTAKNHVRQNFSMQNMIDKTINIYKSVLT